MVAATHQIQEGRIWEERWPRMSAQAQPSTSTTTYLKPLVVSSVTTGFYGIASGSLPPVISAPLCFTAKSRSPRSAPRSPFGACPSALGLPHRPAGLSSTLLGEDADRGVVLRRWGAWISSNFGLPSISGPCSGGVAVGLLEALAAFFGRCRSAGPTGGGVRGLGEAQGGSLGRGAGRARRSPPYHCQLPAASY